MATRALMLDVVVGIADRSFVERDRGETAGIVLREPARAITG